MIVPKLEDRVIIAGGGPVGLVTALGLARQGIPVLVLEAETQMIQDPRGAAFHPPTLDVFAKLGLIEAIMEIGLKVPVWQVREPDGRIVAEFDLSLLKDDTAYPYRFHLGQQKLVPILYSALKEEACAEVRLGVRVTSYVETGDGVRVACLDTEGQPLSFAGRWLIGADGARSAVRKASGIPFEGFTWPERFVVTNLAEDLEHHGFAYTNYIADPYRWAAVLRLEDEAGEPNWRVTYPTDNELSDEAVLDPDDIQQRLAGIVAGAAAPLPLRYAGIYRVHQRVATRFRLGRVLLVGDAAHINNPLGGFGLNSGVQDAANLTEKLALIWRGEASDDLLDRYDRQRRTSNIEFVQKASIRNKQIVAERDPLVRKNALDRLSAIARDPRAARDHLLESSMIRSVRAAELIE